jgi:hypothetical protein
MNAPNRSFDPNNPPFPQNPVPGQTWRNWTWNGCNWTTAPATGIRVLTQTFSSSGPYMPSPGLISCVVECIGGGGAGGGSGNPQNVLTYVLGGGGGGSGGYSRVTLQAAQVAGGVVVTIGAGGLGVPNGVGMPGGMTTFGALCVAAGGSGGQNCDASTGAGNGGNGAPSSGVGDISFPGACGLTGNFQDLAPASWFAASTAFGGWIFGGTVSEQVPSNDGVNGPPGIDHSGAGGGGAVINQAPSSVGSFAGGPGAAGFCIVTEYCWNDGTTAADCCDGAGAGVGRIAGVYDEEGV